VNESAGEKLWKSRSHSFNNNKLDDRDHFQQNAKTSVASLRGLIGSSRNIDRPHSGMLIGFIGIPKKRKCSPISVKCVSETGFSWRRKLEERT